MPDAHMGFGLPIGGVLATDNTVIPYAIGMDIGCRMVLSIIDESDSFMKLFEYQIKHLLKNQTHFGMEVVWTPSRNMGFWIAQYLTRSLF